MSDFNNSLVRDKMIPTMPQKEREKGDKSLKRILPLKVLSKVKRWGPEDARRGYFIPVPVHFAENTVTVTVRLKAKVQGSTNAYVIWPQMADMEDQEVIVSLPEIADELQVVEATEEK